MKEKISEQIRLLNKILEDMDLLENIELAISWMSGTLQTGRPILVCGNGGSAADALHISGELVGKFLRDRKAMNVICLNSNCSVLTAWANDVSYETVFSRQVEAHGQQGGIVLGISTSGNSSNVIDAFRVAKELKMKTIALTGADGGLLGAVADLVICVPSTYTPRIQELHMPIYHYICEQLEQRLAP